MKNNLKARSETGNFMLARSAERGANSYGIIRIIAAVLVIWTHSYSVVGGETAAEPLKELTRWSAGSHAVNIFFSLSGFMVAASWERSRNLFDFVIARILRIMPALVCVNVLIVVLAALFLTTSSPSEFWTVENAGGFLANTTVLFKSGSTLDGVFMNNPWPGVVNIPIWTIKFEVICYATLAAAMFVVSYFRHSIRMLKLALAGFLVVAALVLIGLYGSSQFEFVANLARFFFAFYLGVAAWFWREQIVLAVRYLAIIWLLYLIAIAVESVLVLPLGIVTTAYTSFWAGSFQAGRIQQAADQTDLSYGMYISGFFIQQWLVQAFPQQGIWANATSATLIAAMFAWFSWKLIEHPALQLRSKFWRWRADVHGGPRVEPQI